jgi:hypothetical protein
MSDQSGFTYPEDKEQWLADLIEIGESVVIAYEKYLLDQISYTDLARVMLLLRENLPMKSEQASKSTRLKAKKKER